jgi:hypothetical protein
VKPFTPQEAISFKGEAIPSFVLQAVNELLAARLTNGKASFNQNELIDAAIALGRAQGGLMDADGRNVFFDKGWLNIEELYESYGWEVTYTKPDYTESFPAYFTFKIKK